MNLMHIAPILASSLSEDRYSCFEHSGRQVCLVHRHVRDRGIDFGASFVCAFSFRVITLVQPYTEVLSTL